MAIVGTRGPIPVIPNATRVVMSTAARLAHGDSGRRQVCAMHAGRRRRALAS